MKIGCFSSQMQKNGCPWKSETENDSTENEW